MLNLDNHQNKVKYLLITLGVILVAAIIISIFQFNRELKNTAEVKNIENSANEKTINSAEKQLQELNDIRAKIGTDKELTPEQEQQQRDELEKIRQAQNL